MIVVGLTGGIGSGKSTVSTMLAGRGAVVIDADAIARELQRRATPVFEAIVECFGSAVVGTDGELDRAALASIVFNDGAALKDLNAIVHPAVGSEIARRLAAEHGTDHVVLLDIPLLAESSRYPLAATVVVDVDPDLALERLVELRGMSAADARARMDNQISRADRLALADVVIDNSGDLDALESRMDDLWAWIRTLPEAGRTGVRTK